MKILIDHDAETEHYSNLGLTPLMQASRANHVTVASILIAHGADINAKSRDSKCSPLILASEQGLCAAVSCWCRFYIAYNFVL